MASPKSLKRTYEEAGLNKAASGNPHDQHHTTHIQSSSDPVPKLLDSTTANPPTHSEPISGSLINPINATSTVADQGSKKTKLTFVEKTARRIEKEARDRQKEDERAKKEEERSRKEKEKAEKEEERLKKAEEKRAKEEEKRKVKEERERQREEEKAKKDEEKQKREEEKSKKARSQLRLNAFFGQPTTHTRSSTASPGPDGPDGIASISDRRGSFDNDDAVAVGRRSRSVSETPKKFRVSDFDRAFPPFFVQSNTEIAPSNRFPRDEEGLTYVRAKLDEELQHVQAAPEQTPKLDLEKLLSLAPHKRGYRRKPRTTVKNIISRINGAARYPIDLTGTTDTMEKPSELLKAVPMKYLKFREDVRPPYLGTYTRLEDPALAARIARNPFHKKMPEANYDYDSEAEWEDPGEGEDLDSEGEEEPDEEDEDEMEGFLDDEEAVDARAKRRPLLCDLEPTCTGFCWAGQKHDHDLAVYAIDMLAETPLFPIDPYSTSYWHQPTPTKPSTSIPPHQSMLMEPPRIPLHPINGSNTLLPLSQTPASSLISGSKPPISTPQITNNPKPPKRLIPNDLVNDFKAAIEGSDLTKLGLVEQLKKKFPKQSKDIIRDTLDVVAERVGEKLAEKKWVLRQGE